LINELDMAADVDAMIEKWNPTTFQPKPIDKPSRFTSTNSFENLNNDSDEEDGSDSEQSEPETQQFRKSFVTQKKTDGPMKTLKQKSREIKALMPSKGFQGGTKNPTTTNQTDQSDTTRPKRAESTRKLYEPNFEPTYKRKQTESTMFLEDDDDDLSDLNPAERTFDQMLNCMEQGIKSESGKLTDTNEELVHHAMNDIGGPDPKSQKAIDRLPEKHRQRYNEAIRRHEEKRSNGICEDERCPKWS